VRPTRDASKKWPLVIYLHGKGNRVLTREHLGFAAACAKPANYAERPCFTFAPQCPDENGWSGSKPVRTCSRPEGPDGANCRSIRTASYLTGYSMGGFGTFTFLNDEPRMFAAGCQLLAAQT
jgi:predicted peptidase